MAGRADAGRPALALSALAVVSALALAYDVILALLAFNSENVESPNKGYVVLAVASAIAFVLGLVGLRRRSASALVVALLLVPLLAALLGSTALDLDTAD